MTNEISGLDIHLPISGTTSEFKLLAEFSLIAGEQNHIPTFQKWRTLLTDMLGFYVFIC
jgi:hypothetical protein